MDLKRLKEIVELANTVLPITGPIPNAEQLMIQATQALYELVLEPRTRQTERLKNDLRFIVQEARESEYSDYENLFTDPNSDREDHDLK